MSLDGIYDPANIFARMIRAEVPAHKVYEDDQTLAFMDLFPQSRGHLLVIPKTVAARNLLDLDPAALPALMATVQRMARAVNAALQPDGLMVAQFNGAPAGQTVFHLHFHVIPVYAAGSLRLHARAQADASTLEAHAARIRAVLAAAG